MIRNHKNTTSVSLYLDPDRIIAMRVHTANGRAEVTAWGCVATPGGAISAAMVEDPGRTAQAIRGLLRQIGARERSVTVTLPPLSYTMRALRLPDVPPRERRTVVRGELEETGALRFRGGAFDFLWAPMAVAQGGKHQADAYAFFTSDAKVDSLRETLRLAGLQLERVEPLALGMMRAYLAQQNPPQPVALLCPSAKHSDFCIHDGEQLRYMRRIPGGLDDLGLSPASGAANPGEPPSGTEPTLKMWVQDLASTGEPLSGGGRLTEGPITQELTAADQPLEEATNFMQSQQGVQANFLEAELARSFAFYAREYEGAPRPQALVVLGPAEPAQALRRLLAGNVPLQVVDDEPLASFPLPPPASPVVSTEGQDIYLATIGAALGTLDAGFPPLDISQQEAEATTRRRAPTILFAGIAGSTVWMIASAILAISLAFLESTAQNENARLTEQIATLNAERAPLLRYQAINMAAHAAEAKARLPAQSALGRLAAAATPGVALTNVHVGQDGKVTIEGKGLSAGGIQAFARRVGQGQSIKSPAFEMIRQDQTGGVMFRIVGTFRTLPLPVAAPST